jgi:hypothetical protein
MLPEVRALAYFQRNSGYTTTGTRTAWRFIRRSHFVALYLSATTSIVTSEVGSSNGEADWRERSVKCACPTPRRVLLTQGSETLGACKAVSASQPARTVANFESHQGLRVPRAGPPVAHGKGTLCSLFKADALLPSSTNFQSHPLSILPTKRPRQPSSPRMVMGPP